MPYKYATDKMLIPENKDKRVKLTLCQKEEIFELYATGNYSQRALAREYNVSRRLIQFIIYPEKLEENRQRRQERGGSKQYYNKEANTIAQRTHRQHKQELYLKGELIDNEDESLLKVS